MSLFKCSKPTPQPFTMVILLLPSLNLTTASSTLSLHHYNLTSSTQFSKSQTVKHTLASAQLILISHDILTHPPALFLSESKQRVKTYPTSVKYASAQQIANSN